MPDQDYQWWKIAGAGVTGGLCAFLLARLLGVGPFINKPVILDLPSELLFGGVAALFAVYVLTASDMKAPRTMVFALAAGFFWVPVLAATQSYVTQFGDHQAVGQAKDAAAQIRQADQQSPAAASSAVQNASTQISDAITKLPSVSDPNSKNQILSASKEAISSIPVANATPASVQGLQQIGVASAKSDAPQLSALAVTRLQAIERSSPDLATKNAAREAAFNITNASPMGKVVLASPGAVAGTTAASPASAAQKR